MRGRKATAPTQRTLQNHHRKKLPELSDVTICNHVSQSNSARQRPFLSPPTTIRADALGQLSRVEDVYVHGSMQATCASVRRLGRVSTPGPPLVDTFRERGPPGGPPTGGPLPGEPSGVVPQLAQDSPGRSPGAPQARPPVRAQRAVGEP